MPVLIPVVDDPMVGDTVRYCRMCTFEEQGLIEGGHEVVSCSQESILKMPICDTVGTPEKQSRRRQDPAASVEVKSIRLSQIELLVGHT